MTIRLCSILLLVSGALPLLALQSGCPPEYSAQQCEQMGGGGGTIGTVDGGGSSYCPYSMCGNATGAVQSAYDWCEATQSWSDCPISYCYYRPCIGTNCYPTSETCSTCSSRQGNNVHVSDCPRS